jgi:hypothetical protein
MNSDRHIARPHAVRSALQGQRRLAIAETRQEPRSAETRVLVAGMERGEGPRPSYGARKETAEAGLIRLRSAAACRPAFRIV